MTTPGPILPMVVSGPIDMSPSDLEAAHRRLQQQQQQQPVVVHRPQHLSWQVAATGFATVLVLGWLCIIALLILQERWQLVLVAWILLYAAAHFAYCYCKRNSVTNLKRQLRLRIVAHLSEGHILPGGAVAVYSEKKDDKPPSYNDAIDMEQPPPTYIMALKHTRNNHYSEENESSKGVTQASSKNSSENASNNRDIILHPHSAVLNSAALPIAMALPFSPSSVSLNSLASVHSSKSINDTIPTESTVKTVSESMPTVKTVSESMPTVKTVSESISSTQLPITSSFSE